jgi:hypothetical protein
MAAKQPRGLGTRRMRLIAFHAENIQPIKLVEADDLSDVVVLAGPNGVGKSRFLKWLLDHFQNPTGSPQGHLRFVAQGHLPNQESVPKDWVMVEATTESESIEWGKQVLDTRHRQDATLLMQTLQRTGRKRADTQSSLLNFESDRKITNVQPYQFSWDSLDNSVVFIAPPKDPPVNQAIRVTENDDTHQALRLVGQSIGIVALGKKIVLIEGRHGSLDKQTYGALLRGRFPDLVLVPSGGKGFIQSFGSLNDLVLQKSIWGVNFFMLCDSDAVPSGRDLARLDELSQGRMKVLNRYHLENYFLEADVIARIFEPFETDTSDRSWLRNPSAINDRLKDIAREILSYAAALIVSAHFRERAGNVDLMPKGCQGKTTDELIALFEGAASEERARLADALSASDLSAFTRETMAELERSLSDETWKVKIPGRPVLQIFCSSKHCGLDFGRFKTAYIRATSDMASSPFAEIEQIFTLFSTFDPTASGQPALPSLVDG